MTREELDCRYTAAYAALVAAQTELAAAEHAMVIDRGIPEGPRGTYNQRKYQHLRRHLERLESAYLTALRGEEAQRKITPIRRTLTDCITEQGK